MGRARETRERTRHPVRPRIAHTREPQSAAEAYAAALALAPSIGDHLRIPGSQRFASGVAEAFALLDRAVALDASFAPAHAARGNVLVRGGFLDHARDAYERALALDGANAAYSYALAELAYLARDEARAETLFAQAFAHERLYSPPAPRAGSRHALVLGLAGPWPRNMPLDFVVDDARWTLHRWFLPDPTFAIRTIPPVDLIINALGESEASARALDQVRRIATALHLPCINAPERVSALARHRLAETLAGVPGVVVPRTLRVDRGALFADDVGCAGLAFPFIARPIDTHGGRGLERIASAAELSNYRDALPAQTYDIAAFLDYRSPDGWYRKFRIVAVDGVPFAYHLAIDARWMVHYYRTPTAAIPWMTEEEARFTSDPGEVIAGWQGAVPLLFARLGLDYVGIDCAQLSDGTLVVFEADTAMLIHDLDASPAPEAKRTAFKEIRNALDSAFDRRSRASGG